MPWVRGMAPVPSNSRYIAHTDPRGLWCGPLSLFASLQVEKLCKYLIGLDTHVKLELVAAVLAVCYALVLAYLALREVVNNINLLPGIRRDIAVLPSMQKDIADMQKNIADMQKDIANIKSVVITAVPIAKKAGVKKGMHGHVDKLGFAVSYVVIT